MDWPENSLLLILNSAKYTVVISLFLGNKASFKKQSNVYSFYFQILHKNDDKWNK